MPASYAAIWCRASEPIAVGRVEVGSDALLLRGGRADADVAVPFEAIRDVRFAAHAERLHDLKTLILHPLWGHPLRIATLGLGDARELATLLSDALRA